MGYRTAFVLLSVVLTKCDEQKCASETTVMKIYHKITIKCFVLLSDAVNFPLCSYLQCVALVCTL